MSSCDLAIELDRADRTYRPGEPVTGRVVATAQKDLAVNRLVLQHRWRTHGRGNRDKGNPERQTLFQGEWRAGERQEYPFSFPAPDGQPTYRGRYLNVDWYVVARAELNWKIDPKAEEEILLEPAPVEPDAPPLDPAPFEGAGLSQKGRGCLIAFGGVFAAAGAAMLVLKTLHSLGRVEMTGDVWVAWVLGGVFLAVGLGVVFAGARNLIAKRRLGELVVILDRTRMCPGDAIDVSVRLRPRGELRLSGVTATLCGYESCTSGSGTNKTTHRHQIHRSQHVLVAERRLEDHRTVEGGATLQLPADAPPTFASTSNQLRWSVAVKIDLAGWPDWEEEYFLDVVA